MHTQKDILSATQTFIRNELGKETTGHDYFHIERVVKLAKKIAIKENADIFFVELAAWLHDLGDHKLHNGIDRSEELIVSFLKELSVDDDIIFKIVEIVSQVSFSKGKNAETLEAKIVQDADRLDAIGAIGLARVFAFGGSKHRQIYNPAKPESTSVQHFYDKLLKLKDGMHTETAKLIAAERHAYLEDFLHRFYNEWDGN